MEALKYLEPETLRKGADEAVRQFAIRLHEVPAKDLPACAETLLRLAEPNKQKSKP